MIIDQTERANPVLIHDQIKATTNPGNITWRRISREKQGLKPVYRAFRSKTGPGDAEQTLLVTEQPEGAALHRLHDSYLAYARRHPDIQVYFNRNTPERTYFVRKNS